MKSLLSLVVPTKNRYIYLKHLIKLIDSFNQEELELVIQDNSDDNSEILDFLKGIKNDNIKYYYSNEDLDVTQNSTLSILNSTGEFVCFIGDDDGITGKCLEWVKWMKENNVDSLTCNHASYTWPDIISMVHDFSGSVSVKNNKNKIQFINVKEALHEVLNDGARTMGDLPQLYHGIVSRKCLDIVYKKAGTFFPGPSPDMACAVALGFAVSKHCHIDAPIIISGQGYVSAGGMGSRHSHKGDIESMSFLPKNTAKYWEPMIPKVWTGETIYAESCIKALKNMGEMDCLLDFNYNRLYANFLLFHLEFRNYLTIEQRKEINYFLLSAFYLDYFFKRCLTFISNLLLKRNIGNTNIYFGLNTIIDAAHILEKNRVEK